MTHLLPDFLLVGCDIKPIRTSHPYGSRRGSHSCRSRFPPLALVGAPEILRYPDLSNGLRSDLVVALRHQPLVGSGQRQISYICTQSRFAVMVEATAQSGLMVLPTPLRAHCLNQIVIMEILVRD